MTTMNNDTPRTNAKAVWPASNDDIDKQSLDGSHVPANFARELERENAKLRAIFPRILDALQSGACSPDCSVEFMGQIPAEVAGVVRKLKSQK